MIIGGEIHTCRMKGTPENTPVLGRQRAILGDGYQPHVAPGRHLAVDARMVAVMFSHTSR